MPLEADPYAEKFRQWATLKNQVDKTTSRMNHLRDDLMKHVSEVGDQDERGNSYYALPQPIEVDGVEYRGIKREARTSTVLNHERALAFAAEQGLEDEIVEYVPQIVQESLYDLYAQDRVSQTQLNSLFDTKTSHAFKPDK